MREKVSAKAECASSALVQGAKKETEQPSHATDAHSPRPALQPSSALEF